MDLLRNAIAGAVAESHSYSSVDCIRRELFGPSFSLPAFQVDLNESGGDLNGQPILDLWCLRVADIPSFFLSQPHQFDLLSDRELERHAAFRFQRNRDLYLAKRILARGALSRHTRVQPRDLVFGSNGFGRPHIAEQRNIADLHFNLASSSDLAICLIAREPLSGVDIEDTTKADVSDASDFILSAEERSHIENLLPEQRRRAVLGHWTLKEAYLKARGIGLNLPLSDISFRAEDPTSIAVTFSGVVDDDPKRWRFQQHLLFDRYLMATAIGSR